MEAFNVRLYASNRTLEVEGSIPFSSTGMSFQDLRQQQLSPLFQDSRIAAEPEFKEGHHKKEDLGFKRYKVLVYYGA